MLWKYKKCYQEPNDTVAPPLEICQYIATIDAIYTGTSLDPLISKIQYILYGDITNTPVIIDMDNITLNIVVNQQIKQGSLVVDGITILDENVTLTPLWSVQVNFEPCII